MLKSYRFANIACVTASSEEKTKQNILVLSQLSSTLCVCSKVMQVSGIGAIRWTIGTEKHVSPLWSFWRVILWIRSSLNENTKCLGAQTNQGLPRCAPISPSGLISLQFISSKLSLWYDQSSIKVIITLKAHFFAKLKC